MHHRLLTAREVCSIYRCSRATIYVRLARGEMPEPVRIGGRVLWREADVSSHIDGLAPRQPGRRE